MLSFSKFCFILFFAYKDANKLKKSFRCYLTLTAQNYHRMLKQFSRNKNVQVCTSLVQSRQELEHDDFTIAVLTLLAKARNHGYLIESNIFLTTFLALCAELKI